MLITFINQAIKNKIIGGPIRNPLFLQVNKLKYSKIGVIALLLLGVLIGLTGIVCADPGVNATPETQTISTVTSADVVGLAMETDAATWTISGGDRIFTYWGSWDDPTALNGYEVAQYTTSYDANHHSAGRTYCIHQIYECRHPEQGDEPV